MSLQREPPFRSMIRASGLAEEWTHVDDKDKFKQFGWRCTTKENSYGNTLIGNWNEKRFDIEEQKQAKRLPSQYEHYFDSTYNTAYNAPSQGIPKELKHLKDRHPHSFPGHQPEMDSARLKAIYNSWETTIRASYVDPRIRKEPLIPEARNSNVATNSTQSDDVINMT